MASYAVGSKNGLARDSHRPRLSGEGSGARRTGQYAWDTQVHSPAGPYDTETSYPPIVKFAILVAAPTAAWVGLYSLGAAIFRALGH